MKTEITVAAGHAEEFDTTNVLAMVSRLARAVGGVTQSAIGWGYWADGDIVLREPCVTYTVIHNENDPAHIFELIKFQDDIRASLEQDCILVVDTEVAYSLQ